MRRLCGSVLHGSDHDGLGRLVILLDYFQVQGNFIDNVEGGVGLLHDLLPDGLMKSGDEKLGLEKLAQGDLEVLPDLSLSIVSLDGCCLFV
jgi:hypothetical protein